MNVALERFAELLEHAGLKVIRYANRIGFSCPLHDDRNPSASATGGDRVPVIGSCQVCGDAGNLPAMLEELGATEADRDLILGGKSVAHSHGPAEAVHHDYLDARGLPVLRVVRELRGGKTIKGSIRRQYFLAGEWRWPSDLPESFEKPDTRSLLYNLPTVIEAAQKGETVHIGEGERVVDALTVFGITGTCNVGGASEDGKRPKWTGAHAEQLRGAGSAIYLADNDPAGCAHASAVVSSLDAVGVPVSVVSFCDLPEHADLVDWLAARKGRGLSQRNVRDELLALLRAAPRAVPGSGVETKPASSKGNSGVSYPTPHASAADQWPEPLAGEALQGPAGDWVRILDPHTEADPAAILIQFLTAFGNALNRGPHCLVESDVHTCNLFAVLVGESSKSRKGTSWGHVRRLFRILDEGWASTRVATGLSSGEGLIWAVRDPIEKQQPIRERGLVVGYDPVVVDAGESDKRLLIVESEFSSPLKVMGREGNTLSPIIRAAWDTDSLRSLTKNSPAVATGAHISIIGHISRDELRRELTATDMANGFGNRILWVCVRRSKALPEGGRLDEGQVEAFAARLGLVVEAARKVRRMDRDEGARRLWAQEYLDLSEGGPGLLGAVTSRGEAQVTRLSLIYALLDGSSTVGVQQLRAALAVWDYCKRSAGYVFGGQAAAESAEARERRQIIEVVRGRGGQTTAAELSRSGPRRYRDPEAAERALVALAGAGLGHWQDRPPGPDGGRPTRVFLLGAPSVDTKPSSLEGNSEVKFPLHAGVPAGRDLVADALRGVES